VTREVSVSVGDRERLVKQGPCITAIATCGGGGGTDSEAPAVSHVSCLLVVSNSVTSVARGFLVAGPGDGVKLIKYLRRIRQRSPPWGLDCDHRHVDCVVGLSSIKTGRNCTFCQAVGQEDES